MSRHWDPRIVPGSRRTRRLPAGWKQYRRPWWRRIPRIRAREVLLPLLLLPLLVPLLIGAVTATRAVLAGGIAEAREGLTVLAAFDVVFAVAGWLLFTYVVRD